MTRTLSVDTLSLRTCKAPHIHKGNTSPRPLRRKQQVVPSFELCARASINGCYTVGSALGDGASGIVHIGKHNSSNEIVAIKKIKKEGKTPVQLQRVAREYSIQHICKHPNTIALREVVENPTEIVLVMEWAQGGDLHAYLSELDRPLTDGEAAPLFRQVCRAVANMHTKGFVHRDIKPENILLNEAFDTAYLCDFGFSSPYSECVLTRARCGSLFYAAPEVLDEQPYCGPEVDSWSLGILLYVMCFGTLPFWGEDDKHTTQLIKEARLILTPGTSPLLEDLLRGLIKKNGQDRLSVFQVLRHPWLRE